MQCSDTNCQPSPLSCWPLCCSCLGWRSWRKLSPPRCFPSGASRVDTPPSFSPVDTHTQTLCDDGKKTSSLRFSRQINSQWSKRWELRPRSHVFHHLTNYRAAKSKINTLKVLKATIRMKSAVARLRVEWRNGRESCTFSSARYTTQVAESPAGCTTAVERC